MKKSKQRQQEKTPTVQGVFASSEFFCGLPPECLRILEKISDTREVKPGHTFFKFSETGTMLYVVESGAVQTFRMLGEKKLIIAELKEGAVFGEMGCVGQRTYHCNAQAIGASRVRRIPLAELEKLLEEYPILTRRFLDLVGQRFLNKLMELEATSFRDLIPRLANLLLKKSEGDRVKNVTHRELAEYLHVYRESTTAALGEMRKAGILVVGRKEIQILDRERLERAAREQ